MGGFGTYAGGFVGVVVGGTAGSGARVEGVGGNETGILTFWITPLII